MLNETLAQKEESIYLPWLSFGIISTMNKYSITLYNCLDNTCFVDYCSTVKGCTFFLDA